MADLSLHVVSGGEAILCFSICSTFHCVLYQVVKLFYGKSNERETHGIVSVHIIAGLSILFCTAAD
jgi:hypothetical protein